LEISSTEIGNLPQPKALVGILPVVLRAILIDDQERPRQMEWAQLEIQGSPTESIEFLILGSLRIRCCEEIDRPTPLDILERRQNVAVREMTETVSGQNEIYLREWISDKISQQKRPSFTAVHSLISFYHRRYDIRAGVLDSPEWHLLDPVVIPAWNIEEGPHTQVSQ
jgi:hypothetical protein